MSKKQTCILLGVTILLCAAHFGYSQLQNLDIAATAVGSTGYVRFNNPAELGQKSESGINYSDIRGTCYWEDDWKPALLILKSGNGVKMQNVKLNLYKNDVHYLVLGSELVAQTGTINRVIFYDKKDTTKVVAIFQQTVNHLLSNEDGFSYIQMLNTGKIRLMKRIKIELMQRDKDVMSGKVTYKFDNSESYYLLSDGSFRRLKNLSKASLFEVLKPIDTSEKWLQENKNKLKKESDVIAYLEFIGNSK